MKGGLVTLYEFENAREIIVLKEGDQDTEYPEGSLVIRDDDTHEYLREDEFNSIQMKEWIMNGLNKIGYGIGNPQDITLYKNGKLSGDLFTGDGMEDAEDDISIYVSLPSRDAEIAQPPESVPPVRPGAQMRTPGKLSRGEEILEYLQREAEGLGEEFLGTGILKMYNAGSVTLEELKSFYNIYIKDEKVNNKDKNGLRMIIFAIHNDLYDVIEFLLNVPGIDITGSTSIDNPLLFSVMQDKLEMVQYLLDLKNEDGTYKIDVNFMDDKKTPIIFYGFMRYDQTGDDEILKTLLKRADIEINLSNDEGNTPLHVLCKIAVGNQFYEPIKIINILIEKGANKRVKNKNGLQPRDIIIGYIRSDVITDELRIKLISILKILDL